MSIIIRRATNLDARLIANLSRQTFYDTFAPFNTKDDMDKFMNEQFTIEKLEEEVIKGEDIFLLGFDGDDAVGYVRMRDGDYHPVFNDNSSIEIARIYATARSIGKGVGKALMNECLRIANELGRKIIWLGVWEKNERAIAFYSKFGFEKFDTHNFLLGNDLQLDWLMKRQVNL